MTQLWRGGAAFFGVRHGELEEKLSPVATARDARRQGVRRKKE